MGSDTSSGQFDAADRLAFIGFAFLTVYGALVLVPWAFLVAGVSVASWMVPLAVIVAGLVLYLFAGADRVRSVWVSLGVVGAVLLVGIIVALSFYDASVDGRWYHQNAVISLSEGWNPISNADPGIVPGLQYVRSYPKAFWIAAAPLGELFGSIEAGKALHFLPLGASFFLTMSLLVRLNIRTGLAVAGAALAAVNPIWILESLSFYLDGQIASLLVVAVVAGLWIVLFADHRLATASLAISLVLLINLKFTGLFYAGLILLGLGGVLLWQRRWPELRRMIAVNGIAVVLAVGVVGFNPYIQNTLDFGNPFYPVYGEGSVDFITDNTPANLRQESQFVQLYYGIFGRPANPIDADAELAVPFSPDSLSISYPYTGPGARTAGFGPLFSGALVLSLLGLAWVSMSEPRRSARLLVGLVVLFLVATVVLHPEGWWARYTPQLWLVPVVVIVAAGSMTSRPVRWMGAAIALVLAVNLVYVIRPYAESNIEFSRDVGQMYEPFADGSEVMAVFLSEWALQTSTVVQMDEAGVRYATFDSIEELPCSSPRRLLNQAGVYCPADEAG